MLESDVRLENVQNQEVLTNQKCGTESVAKQIGSGQFEWKERDRARRHVLSTKSMATRANGERQPSPEKEAEEAMDSNECGFSQFMKTNRPNRKSNHFAILFTLFKKSKECEACTRSKWKMRKKRRTWNERIGNEWGMEWALCLAVNKVERWRWSCFAQAGPEVMVRSV